MNLGFSSETPANFNLKLVEMGIAIGSGNEMQQYWRLSMDMLEKELQNVFDNLCKSLASTNKENYTFNNEQEYLKRFEQFKDSVSKISWSDSDITLSPTNFYNKFLAYSVNVKNLGYKDWRDSFEHIGASYQCDVAQKKINEIISWDTCYICGNAIQDRYQTQNIIIHETRECEHLLPAFTSLGYKGLIQSSNADQLNRLPEDYLDYFRYEYANAHRCCNRIKSEDKWIKYDTNEKIYKVDMNTLGTTLTNIFTSNQYDCNKINKNYKDFVISRGNFVIENFLNPILNLINNEKKEYGDLFDLKIRINQISALKTNINQIAYAILTGETPAQPPKINIKIYNITTAKFLIKKQFSHPEQLFFEVFNDLFSDSDVNTIEILFSFFFNQQLRKFARISRKIFDLGIQQMNQNTSFLNISKEMLLKSLNEIDTLFSGIDEVDETKLIPFNNTKIIDLKMEFSNKLYEIINKIINSYSVNYPNMNSQIEILKQKIQESANKDQNEDNQTKNEAINEFAYVKSVISTNAFAAGGARISKLKKKPTQIYKKMTGGTIENEFENSYKQDILEIADELGFDPSRYGINVQTTRSGRVSKPPLRYVGLQNGMNGIQIGNSTFIIDYANNGIRPNDNQQMLIPFTYQNQRRGIVDNNGNFYQVAGRKKKLYKKTKK